MSYNKAILLGNCTRDVETRFTPKGMAIAAVGLALNRKWKDADGSMKESVAFVDLKAFGKTAELLGQHYKKGQSLMVEARVEQESWDDKQSGQKRSKIVFVVENIIFTGGDRRQESESPARPAARPSAKPTEPKTSETPGASEKSDDCPF